MDSTGMTGFLQKLGGHCKDLHQRTKDVTRLPLKMVPAITPMCATLNLSQIWNQCRVMWCNNAVTWVGGVGALAGGMEGWGGGMMGYWVVHTVWMNMHHNTGI